MEQLCHTIKQGEHIRLSQLPIHKVTFNNHPLVDFEQAVGPGTFCFQSEHPFLLRINRTYLGIPSDVFPAVAMALIWFLIYYAFVMPFLARELEKENEKKEFAIKY